MGPEVHSRHGVGWDLVVVVPAQGPALAVVVEVALDLVGVVQVVLQALVLVLVNLVVLRLLEGERLTVLEGPAGQVDLVVVPVVGPDLAEVGQGVLV